jgi:hypothetical protein
VTADTGNLDTAPDVLSVITGYAAFAVETTFELWLSAAITPVAWWRLMAGGRRDRDH